MDTNKEYPITIFLHSDTGIPPVGVNFYYDTFPNSIVGYQGSTPFRINYNDISMIVGPDSTKEIIDAAKHMVSIQKYEYILSMDKRVLDFASHIKKIELDKKDTEHDHRDYC